MKNILPILFILLFPFYSFAEDFKIQPPSLADYTNVESFDEEVVNIGGQQITRGELSSMAGLNQNNTNCPNAQNDSFLNNPNFQTAVNVSLIASILHTAFQAEKDKQKHAIIGALISAGTTKLCQKVFNGKNKNLVCALTGAGAALIAGILKEYRDSKGHGTVDAKDAIYTFVPGALISFKLSF